MAKNKAYPIGPVMVRLMDERFNYDISKLDLNDEGIQTLLGLWVGMKNAYINVCDFTKEEMEG